MSTALCTADLPVRTTALPNQLFAGSGVPSPGRMTAVTNAGGTKPRGGMWTSTRTAAGRSEWVTFCEREYAAGLAGATHRVTLHVLPGARIAEVDSRADLAALMASYSYLQQGWGDRPQLDFEALAADFDGLHLTDNGETAMRSGYSGAELYGWDFESTLWFRWAFAVPGTTAATTA